MNNNIDFSLSKNKKNHVNMLINWLAMFFSLFLGIIFISLFIFIFIYAIQGFSNFGLSNILFSSNFNSSIEQYSFWVPFTATILTSSIALLFAIPIGIKVAIFTKYRLPKHFRKYILIVFQTLSGIPSVIFGFFASQSLGIILEFIFGISSYSILNGGIMLTFMVIPTIISMTLDSLNSSDNTLLINAQAMGITKTRSIYKICKKAARSGIIVAIIIALSRAIGESMAVSMILQSTPNNNIISGGFFATLNSSSQTIGAYISTAMFADNDPDRIRPLLYSFGLIMLFFSMILNMFVLIASKNKNKKINSKFKKIELYLEEFVLWLPKQIKILFEKITFKSSYTISNEDLSSVTSYIRERSLSYKFKWVYPSWKIVTEIVSVSLCFVFLFWIIGDVVFNGILGVNSDPNSFFIYSKNSISQSFINTLLIILVCISIGFPLALMCAIFLNEYSKEGKLKRIIIFFLDSLGTTPSIIFGMFGLLFFIQTLGWTSQGSLGNSLVAGALTLIIVILPSFIRLLEQSLKNVSIDLRINAYALGNTKWETIKKIVLPAAMASITTSIISTIGRIFSETAPLYLTAGLSSSQITALDRPGTTLTTHIYAQIYSTSSNATSIQYQAAMLTLIIVFSLVIIGYLIIPNRKIIKDNLIKFKNDLKSNIVNSYENKTI